MTYLAAVFIKYTEYLIIRFNDWLRITLFTECQSEIIQLHPDSTFYDISIKK